MWIKNAKVKPVTKAKAGGVILISRENHRFLKSLNREQFSKKLYDYYSQAYNEGAYETECAIYRQLADSFGFDNEDIDKLRKGVFSDIEAINQKYVTANEIMNGLINEGFVSLKGETK